MAEGDITPTNNIKEQLFLGGPDFGSGGDTFKVCLVKSGYSWSVDGNPSYNDTAVTSNEIPGTVSGYSTGGTTIGSQTVTQNDAGDYAKFDGGNITWTSLATITGTLAHALIYDDTITTPVAKPIVARVELSQQPTGGNYQIAWNANGILQLG